MNEGKHVSDDVEVLSAKDNGNNDVDYDFSIDDADLVRMSAEKNHGPDVDGLGLVDGDDILDGDAEADDKDSTSAVEVQEKSKMKFIIIAVASIALIVLSVFGYFAIQILGGGQSTTPQASSSNDQFIEYSRADKDQGNDFSAMSDSAGNNFSAPVTDAENLAAELGLSQPAQEITQQPRQEYVEPQPVRQEAASKLDNIVITQGAESLGPVTKEDRLVTNTASVTQISEEERLYDNLLSSVEGLDVPPEAIKIDQSVINRRIEDQRLVTLEQEIKEARSSVADIKGTIEGIRTQIDGFTQMLEKSSTNQAVVNESIAKLAQQFKQLSVGQEKELKAMKAEVSKAKRSADQAVANTIEAKRAAQPANTSVAIRQPATAQEPVRQAVVQAPKTATVLPTKVFEEARKPATVQIAAQAPASESNMPAHCNGSRVSANWRVKGVNSHSAYVVRTQDQQGMYLKVGVDVPGYGQVQVFDSNNRAVCTTSGLIRR